MNSKAYHVALSMVEGIGPRWISTLTRIFGSAQEVWKAAENDLRQVPKIPARVVSNLIARRNRLDPFEEFAKLENKGIGVISVHDHEYPPALRQIYDPPQIIFVRGNTGVLQNPMFAVIGARKATNYGTAVACRIAGDLSRTGLMIVSGMARGIDTAAHKGALEIPAPTVAVLGCGVDVTYPKENKKVMEEIIDIGAVISEFPPGTSPAAGNFPQRNRIISGLAEGVLVIEAAENSGSLITVDFALEQGRDVFAVPGQVTNKLNKGSHKLIKQGAKLVEDVGDILEEIGLRLNLSKMDNGIDETEYKSGLDLTSSEKKLYNIISDEPVAVESLIEKSRLKSSEVISLLLMMEIKGLIKQIPGQRYIRCL